MKTCTQPCSECPFSPNRQPTATEELVEIALKRIKAGERWVCHKSAGPGGSLNDRSMYCAGAPQPPRNFPIIFQPWKVKKILSWDWSKGNMQTRRLAGLSQFNGQPDRWRWEGDFMAFDGGFYYVKPPVSKYGGSGDHLWVRERFMITYPCAAPSDDPWGAGEPTEYIGPLPHEKPVSLLDNWWTLHYYVDWVEGKSTWKWRPSIFMPAWASRITLEVVSTRIERLQSISQDDAISEGVEPNCKYHDPYACADCYNTGWANPPVDDYQDIWDQINGKNVQTSWAANPWVRVVEYKLFTGDL